MPENKLIGQVGLGNMGAAVASRLVRHGRVLGFDLGQEQRDNAARLGVEVVAGLDGLAEAAVVVLSLPSPKASLAVARELGQLLEPGAVVIETSTVNPGDMRDLEAVLSPDGIRLVDAAILSGVGGMRDGISTLLTGGAEADLAAVEPVLKAMSGRIIRFGELGAGMAAKVINNAVAHAVFVLLAEAAALAATSGVDVAKVMELLGDPEAGLTRPLTHRMQERVARARYDGGMPTDAARKDSTLALALAQANGVPLFAIQGAHTAYDLAVTAGLGRQDYAALATLWEQWTGTSFASTDLWTALTYGQHCRVSRRNRPYSS
jgi:3-hydroxyisobutyrate dehydrogenase-like beta-hydroxyacid dehydrogenase